MDSFITPNKGLCAIEITPDGVALAFTPNSTKPNVTICEFLPYANGNSFSIDNLKTDLNKFIGQHGLKKTTCYWVLNPEHYRLTLLNTPNVPPSEYKNAVRWQIKDIINYPLEDVTVDVFYPDETGATPKKIYVVASQLSFLQEIVSLLEECGLHPDAIDIREFAIRNLLSKIIGPDESAGFIEINQENTLVTFTKNDKVEFVRRIPLNLQKIKDNHNTLITELERSFSYCETELSQEIPSKFFLPPETILDSGNIEEIAKHFNKEITIIPLESVTEFKVQLDQDLQNKCWVVIGELLRDTI